MDYDILHHISLYLANIVNRSLLHGLLLPCRGGQQGAHALHSYVVDVGAAAAACVRLLQHDAVLLLDGSHPGFVVEHGPMILRLQQLGAGHEVAQGFQLEEDEAVAPCIVRSVPEILRASSCMLSPLRLKRGSVRVTGSPSPKTLMAPSSSAGTPEDCGASRGAWTSESGWVSVAMARKGERSGGRQERAAPDPARSVIPLALKAPVQPHLSDFAS